MRSVILTIAVIAALITLGFYVLKTNRVHNDVKKALQTESADIAIERMTQVPGAAKKKLDEAVGKAQENLESGMKDLEK